MSNQSILEIGEVQEIDESIEDYEFVQYDPATGTNLDNSGSIRIPIEGQSIFTHTAESYLVTGTEAGNIRTASKTD